MLTLKVALLISLSLAAAANILPKISNGDEAQITEFPYLVSIQQINVHICAGTLLSEQWILSSARCYATRPLAELNIEYGNSVISPGPIGLKKTGISRVILHQDFEMNPLVNDISLAEPVVSIITGFHESFVKLTVPGGSRFISGTNSVHAGWGHISESVRTTSLQKANLRVLSPQECIEATVETKNPERSNICAVANSVMCLGDLGTHASLQFVFSD